MIHVDKISYGTATAAMRTCRVESAAEEGVLKLWEKKIMDDTTVLLLYYRFTEQKMYRDWAYKSCVVFQNV